MRGSARLERRDEANNAERVGRELVLIVYGLLRHQHPQPFLPKLPDDVLCHTPESPPAIHRDHGSNRLPVSHDHEFVLCVGDTVEEGGELQAEWSKDQV